MFEAKHRRGFVHVEQAIAEIVSPTFSMSLATPHLATALP